MADNIPAAYGRDVRCLRDADELMSEVEGIDVIKQDTFHLITCEDFLGPEGDKRGTDLRKLAGGTEEDLIRAGAIVSQVIQDADPRIETCDVELKSLKNSNGTLDVWVSIRCQTALGPFDIVGFIGEIYKSQGEQ